VLIIDDQPMARAWVRGILQTEFDCFETESVQEFFELALAERPDVILADLEMVPLSGLQLCRLAKAKPALAEVPFLLLTAHESAEDKLASLADGVDDHLAKSITPRELLGRVRATVRLRRSLLRAANLEALVEQRTTELSAATERLKAEILERERVEAELARVRQTLGALEDFVNAGRNDEAPADPNQALGTVLPLDVGTP
jgi:DNA-binding response OmpR family regulator